MAAHDPRRTDLPINSYVLVDYPTGGLTNGPPSKLLTHRKGPMRVVNFVGSTYTLENLVNNKLKDYHITSLTPFLYDTVEDPRLIENKDSQMWDVETVLRHRGDVNGSKKQLFFLVKWVRYEESDNTWELWENLRDNVKLHEYLASHRLRRLIPLKFREE